jgi:hypothetical protein
VTNTDAGNLVLRADNAGMVQGTVIFDSGGPILRRSRSATNIPAAQLGLPYRRA